MRSVLSGKIQKAVVLKKPETTEETVTCYFKLSFNVRSSPSG